MRRRCGACRRSGPWGGARELPFEAVEDQLAADAVAGGDAERAELEDGLRLPPLRQGRGHVASDDEGQLVLRARFMEPVEGIDRVRAPRDVGLRAGDRQALVRGHGRLAHRHAVVDARVADGLLVRRRVHGNQQHAVEAELRPRLLRADHVGDVRRVERPAEQADARH
jgi:hypothetical protein